MTTLAEHVDKFVWTNWPAGGSETLRFNPYHDEQGRFTSGDGSAASAVIIPPPSPTAPPIAPASFTKYNLKGSEAFVGTITGSELEQTMARHALDSYPKEQIAAANISEIRFVDHLPLKGAAGVFNTMNRRITVVRQKDQVEQLRVLHHEIGHSVDLGPIVLGTNGQPISQVHSNGALGRVSARLRAVYDQHFAVAFPEAPRGTVAPESGYHLWESGYAERAWHRLSASGYQTPVTPYALSNKREYVAETVGNYLFARRLGLPDNPVAVDHGAYAIMRDLYGD